MKLHIILAQRKCSYAGQYAPEALEVADEYTMEDNPEWFADKMSYYIGSDEYDSVKEMVVRVNNADVDRCLFPEKVEVDGKVVLQ